MANGMTWDLLQLIWQQGSMTACSGVILTTVNGTPRLGKAKGQRPCPSASFSLKLYIDDS